MVFDCEGFKTSWRKSTVDVVEMARELESEVEHEDVTILLQSRGKILTDEELPHLDEQKKERILQTEFFPGEDAVKIAEMTTNDLEYYINVVDKTGFEKID